MEKNSLSSLFKVHETIHMIGEKSQMVAINDTKVSLWTQEENVQKKFKTCYNLR